MSCLVRVLACLLVLMIAAAVAPAEAFSQVGVPAASLLQTGGSLGPERLANPGFEDGLTGWDRPSWFASVAAPHGSIVRTGMQAFRFGGKASGPYLQQDVTATAGETIVFSGWINVPTYKTGGGGVVELQALNAGRGAITTWVLYTVPTSTAGWVPITASRTLPAGSAYARLRIRFPTLDGTIYLDDLSVRSSVAGSSPSVTPSATSTGTALATSTATATATTTQVLSSPASDTPTSTSTPTRTPTATPSPSPTEDAGPVGPERLQDGGFEAGLAGWTLPTWYANVAGPHGTALHSGAQGLRFSGRASGPYVQQDVPVAAFEPLSFSGWVRVAVRNAAMSGAIELEIYNAQNRMITSRRIYSFATVTNGWVPIADAITMPGGATMARLRVRFQTLDGTVYLDDLSFRGPPPAPTAPPTNTPTSTATATQTATPSVTASATSTPTVTATATESVTATTTVTVGPVEGTGTSTPTPSSTPTSTPTSESPASVTPSPTSTATATTTATVTPTITVTGTPGLTATPLPTGATLFGAWVGTSVNVAGNEEAFEQAVGKRRLIRHWYWSVAPISTNATNFQAWSSSTPADVTLLLSWAPSPVDSTLDRVNGGEHDAYIAQWARVLRDHGGEVWLRPMWEDNGSWFWWRSGGPTDETTRAKFKAAWRRMVDIYRREGAYNVKFVWSPHARMFGLAKPLQSYPGDAYVDWVALDGYPLRGGAGDFFATFKPDYDELVTLNKPMMIAETGINIVSDASRASYITNLLTHELPNRFPKIVAFVWFSEPGWGDILDPNYPLTRAAFRDGIASPYLIGAPGSPPPTATPTPSVTSTLTLTPTSTATYTLTPTPTDTSTGTPTPENSPTNTPTSTATATLTPEPTIRPTETPTSTPTATPGIEHTETPTPSPTHTPTPSPTNTTATPVDTSTPTLTETPLPLTETPTATPSSTATATPTASSTATPTVTDTPTVAPTETATATTTPMEEP